MARKVLTSVTVWVAVFCTARLTLAQEAPRGSAAAAATAPAATPNSPAALLEVLRNPEASQAERDEAARRLVALKSDQAIDALHKTLINTANAKGQQSVARALADDPVPDPNFIVPLAALIGNDPVSTEAAARALANYRGNADARRWLLDAAADPNRKLPAPARAAVIRSLAPLADKRTARTLVDIVTSDAEGVATRNIAADELAEMTGFAGAGRDPQRWRQWWNENGAKPDAQFDAEVLAARAARLDRLEPKYERLVAEVRELLTESFQDAPPARKEEDLLKYLRSPESEVRLVGAGLVVYLFNENMPIPDSARQQLRTMVGDSDPKVRLEVAGALHDINDAAALEAVLAQLAVERDPAVRAALAEALAPMGDARAVPALIGLLRDDSLAVVNAAAQALEGLRDQLRDKATPELARQTSRALNEALARTGAPGTAALREQIVAAMVAWAHPDVRQTFASLLRPNEPPRTRQQALAYFGKMTAETDPWPASNIITSGALLDRDEAVRLAAVQALAKTARAEHAENLYERSVKPGELGREGEPSEKIRQEAWKALTAMFPRQFEIEQLNAWADRFRDEPQRRLTILEALRNKLIERGRADNELAVVRQNIGVEYVKLGQFGKAAVEFKLALEAVQQNQVKDHLVDQLLNAYLRGGNYEEAIQFGAKMIAENRGNQLRVGSAITNEVEELTNGSPQGALRLAMLALQMDPALPEPFAGRLRRMEAALRANVESPTTAPGS